VQKSSVLAAQAHLSFRISSAMRAIAVLLATLAYAGSGRRVAAPVQLEDTGDSLTSLAALLLAQNPAAAQGLSFAMGRARMPDVVAVRTDENLRAEIEREAGNPNWWWYQKSPWVNWNSQKGIAGTEPEASPRLRIRKGGKLFEPRSKPSDKSEARVKRAQTEKKKYSPSAAGKILNKDKASSYKGGFWQVIMKSELDRVGKPGDVVSVKPNYAQNVLIPKGYAVRATPEELQAFEAKRKAEEAAAEEKKGAAKEIQNEIESYYSKGMLFAMEAGPEGNLFGKVTNTLIQQRIEDEMGLQLDKRDIKAPELTHVGEGIAEIKVFSDVTANVKIVITASNRKK